MAVFSTGCVDYFPESRDDWPRGALQNHLVRLCMQCTGGIFNPSQNRRGSGEVPLRLCDGRFCYKRVCIVRCDIENLIKLSHRVRETTKRDIGMSVRRE